jgi:hypothetical protein
MIFKQLDGKTLLKDLITSLFYVVIILYLTQMTPQLPQMIKDLYKNNIFRVVILFIILVLANISQPAALIVSIAFVVTMNNLQIDYFEEEVKKEVAKVTPEIATPEIAVPQVPEENEQTGCFDQRPADMSKVSPVFEEQGDIFGEVQFA